MTVRITEFADKNAANYGGHLYLGKKVFHFITITITGLVLVFVILRFYGQKNGKTAKKGGGNVIPDLKCQFGYLRIRIFQAHVIL